MKHIHIAAFDVLLGDRHALDLDVTPYAISEINFAPLITLPANLKKVVDHHVHNS
jgi:hypothetical protein